MPSRRKPENNQPSPRNLEIYSRLCRGEKPSVVAKKYGVSPGRVCQVRNQAERWFRPQWAGKISAIKKKHVQLLSLHYIELMDAWEASKGVEVETVDETGDGPNGEPRSKHVVKKRKPTGSASYMAEARAVLADIRKIWGADAPQKAELSGPDGESLLSADDRRTSILGILDSLRQRQGTGANPKPVNGRRGMSPSTDAETGDISQN